MNRCHGATVFGNTTVLSKQACQPISMAQLCPKCHPDRRQWPHHPCRSKCRRRRGRRRKRNLPRENTSGSKRSSVVVAEVEEGRGFSSLIVGRTLRFGRAQTVLARSSRPRRILS